MFIFRKIDARNNLCLHSCRHLVLNLRNTKLNWQLFIRLSNWFCCKLWNLQFKQFRQAGRMKWIINGENSIFEPNRWVLMFKICHRWKSGKKSLPGRDLIRYESRTKFSLTNVSCLLLSNVCYVSDTFPIFGTKQPHICKNVQGL